ncbi:hypothetical protein, partial [Arthrobacter sp. H35-D1]|uniref:hypothetical protein n=1 Tax=Arthrobacter sp. H35-D1 TaxID=3046202 RepID=UPI0024BAB7D1
MSYRGHELLVLPDGHVPVNMNQPAPGLAEEQSLLRHQISMTGLLPVGIQMTHDPVANTTQTIRILPLPGLH